MELSDALSYASHHKHGVLITLRSDGRPQSSDIVYGTTDGLIRISVTDDRAKTRNLRRDPRCLLHLTVPGDWAYASFDCEAELSPVAAEPDDATCDELVDLYRQLGGEHGDWDEYRRAMVDEGRLVVRLTPFNVVGRIPD